VKAPNTDHTNMSTGLLKVEEAIRDLVKLGLVADSGLRRNGQILWELTPLGKMRAEWDAQGSRG
jgi:hypothetical protein